MILTSIANEGTILHWARDHRTHHKYSETRADPHNALRGFFFSHVGWLLYKKDPRVKFAGKHVSVEDLLALSEVQFQTRIDPIFNLVCCFLLPALISLYWNETFYNGFMVMGVIKYIVTLHATWLVNSAAHLYGGHPYDDTINPAESPLVSFASVGEGWHNYHHAFPSDYSASEFGASTQFNPTRVLIDLCAAFGLVWDRNRSTNLWKRRMEAKQISGLHMTGPPLFRQRELRQKIDFDGKA
jgi:stearoyl-CoA desaturase (delta-9 desaturase)